MTTLNRMRVVSIDGPRVFLHAKYVYGWDWNTSLIPSRTQALHFLEEPLLGYIRQDIPFPDGSQITWEEANALALTLPLGKELSERETTDEAWNRANVGRFISCVGVVDRRHCVDFWNGSNDLDERWEGMTRDDFETPEATFLIAVADPQWLAHLIPGMEWRSTAYDHDEKIAFDSMWRTSDVLALARSIDSAQDFSGMPILADALQEAGCDCDDLLNHLRDSSAAHVRGCWALDLVLGKE